MARMGRRRWLGRGTEFSRVIRCNGVNGKGVGCLRSFGVPGRDELLN